MMLIKVLGNDNSIGFVEDYYLEDFIRTRRITAFFRNNSKEWVDITREPIRMDGTNQYKGPDKRRGIRTLAGARNLRGNASRQQESE